MDLQKLFYYDLFEKNFTLDTLKQSMKINIPKIYGDILLDLSKLTTTDIDNVIEKTLDEVNILNVDKTNVSFSLSQWEMRYKFIVYSKYSELLHSRINTTETQEVIPVEPDTNVRGMNETNIRALEVLLNEGSNAFVKHCFTGDNGEKLSYSEMRARYG